MRSATTTGRAPGSIGSWQIIRASIGMSMEKGCPVLSPSRFVRSDIVNTDLTRRSFIVGTVCTCWTCAVIRSVDVDAKPRSQLLADVSPELELILTRGNLPPPKYEASTIKRESVWVTMRDGIRLRTDLYLPPVPKAPTIAMRTPYDRARYEKTFIVFA